MIKQQTTAKIYQFPTLQQRNAARYSKSPVHPLRPLPVVDGPGWYHEAALAEASEDYDRKQH